MPFVGTAPAGSPAATEAGLSSREAAERLARYGLNEPVKRQRSPVLVEIGRLFLTPLVGILLMAAMVSGAVGQMADALIIVVMVLLGAGINFTQTYRSQKATEKLQEQIAPTATVKRDGEWIEMARSQVVPGDVVRLAAGDLVPADARLLAARDLYVQQASLTGESLPVEKDATRGETDDASKVFLGTSVVSGTAIALVTATGGATVFAGIAARLAARPAETEFERGLRQFGGLILQTVVFLLLFLLVISIVLHRDPLESLLFAVALAVGLTPEFLPMITSVTLARGAVRMARQGVIVRHLAAIQNLGSIGVLCTDKTGTLTGGSMVLDSILDPFGAPGMRALELGWLNSYFETGVRSPLDAVILQRSGMEAGSWSKCDEVPFDFERRRLSVVVERPGERLLITKGSPEEVVALAVAAEVEGRQQALDDGARARCRKAYESLSAQGFRLLAVAYRAGWTSASCSRSDERDLTLAGFLAFADPALPDVADTVAALRRDGVTLKVLTGDNPLVAQHVCGEVGIEAVDLVLGEEIDRLGDDALGAVAERASVFARMSPAQKNRVISALKRRGYVVGFLGDGINDAPSLRAADVGIAAAHAVSVARQAADIVMVDPGLRVLHTGILEGRRAFGNVMKYLLMGTSSNFGNMLSMAAASLFLPFLPMLPTQILLNSFLYDLAQVTIPTDNVDEEYLESPQKWDVSLIRRFMLAVGPVSSLYDFLTFFVLLRVLKAGEAEFHTGWFVESLATQTLVLFVIRTLRHPFRSRPSGALTATVLGVVLIGLVLPISPLAGALGFTPLPPRYFVFLAFAAVTYLGLVEAVKRRLFRVLQPAQA